VGSFVLISGNDRASSRTLTMSSHLRAFSLRCSALSPEVEPAVYW
jgi:hypothetical protein